MIRDYFDSALRGAEDLAAQASQAMFDPVVRLGVTGLARAGKTVFITSLVANLLDRGRMTGLTAQRDGRIEAAYLQPQPDDTVPRFAYEAHLADLLSDTPKWPQSTRSISELRLSFRIAPQSMLGSIWGTRRLHLDIVDYPGEWLLDLGLLDQSYGDWARDVLARIATRPEAAQYLEAISKIDPAQPLDQGQAAELGSLFAEYLREARKGGHADGTPGRMLMPGDMEGSPVLSIAPLPLVADAARGSLWREMARRFAAYKRLVVRPFFRDHFARIDRQVVLVDALAALEQGPEALRDARDAMAGVLGAFRPGRSDRLARLIGMRRVDRILFAATKADHLHHSQHDRLTALMDAMTREARDHAAFRGAQTAAMAIASIRATTEDQRDQNGEQLGFVCGRMEDDPNRIVAVHPGELPDQPARLLHAQNGDWPNVSRTRFAPAPLTLSDGDGPPHIRLDRAAEFLFGDKL